ncbi:Uncharacterized protein Adt_06151 [Abeliophyllum distichum]|uniref:Uncharacterized protein n=1 Tax=Abeliophyllum distichum TaxID=126358 RepID=A0ABD1V642_9LAMI
MKSLPSNKLIVKTSTKHWKGSRSCAKCPSHDFALAAQNHYFYSGLTSNGCSSVDSVAGGSIQNRSARELHDCMKTTNEQFEQFVVWLDRGWQKKIMGMHEVEINTLLMTKIDLLA